MEPHKPRHWKLPSSSGCHKFHTCARPGRSKGADENVPDKLIHAWVRRLAAERDLVIVSLLGQKPDGTSEWSFYSFYKKGRSFQDWLDEHYAEKAIQVSEHPTTDFCRVPDKILAAVSEEILLHVQSGRTVVVMDSGGEQRTGQVCKYMKAVESFSN